jgi:integrase
MNKEGKSSATREYGEGGLIQQEGSPFWYTLIRVRGKQYKKSTGTSVKQEALKILRARQQEAEASGPPSREDSKLTYKNLREVLLSDYEEQENRALLHNKETGKPYISSLTQLDKYFSDWKVSEITTHSVDRFKASLKGKVANGTINRSLAALRRMFKLAIEKGRKIQAPVIKMLPEAEPRQGFLDVADYDKLHAALPEYVRPMLQTGYYTGMRLGEIVNLKWGSVDLAEGEIRLAGEDTKNKQPRTIPLIDGLPDMMEGLRRANPDAEYVFLSPKGEVVSSFIKAWRNACVKAAIPTRINGREVVSHFDEKTGEYVGLIFHDLRRSAIRNLIRAGVDQTVAKEISGHKTDAVFKRYNITDGKDLRKAADKVTKFLKDQREANAAAPTQSKLRVVAS